MADAEQSESSARLLRTSKRRQNHEGLKRLDPDARPGFYFLRKGRDPDCGPVNRLAALSRADSRLHLGNEPNKLPDSQICQSHMQANFYTVFDSKVDATVAWYASHLDGFHKTHAYVDNRSQDKFYNDAGTIVVSVLGDIGKEGENVDTYAVTYYHFQPGLPAKAIISFGQHKMVCR